MCDKDQVDSDTQLYDMHQFKVREVLSNLIASKETSKWGQEVVIKMLYAYLDENKFLHDDE